MLYYEHKLKLKGFNFIIGVDEAGRGPLAGPVVAAAVYLKKRRFKNRIDDSKKLTHLQRERAYQEIIQHSLFGLGIISEKVIDGSGIVHATTLAMKNAVDELIGKITDKDKYSIHIIVDGGMLLELGYPSTSIIKGDGKSLSIASASILAKVTRDGIMREYHYVFPQYNFLKHKGYPTKEHKRIIRKIGLSSIHRKTFSYV